LHFISPRFGARPYWPVFLCSKIPPYGVDANSISNNLSKSHSPNIYLANSPSNLASQTVFYSNSLPIHPFYSESITIGPTCQSLPLSSSSPSLQIPFPLPSVTAAPSLFAHRQCSGSVCRCPSSRALTGRLVSLNLAVEQRRHRHSLPSPTHPADEAAAGLRRAR
jgi:hypothetical protein